MRLIGLCATLVLAFLLAVITSQTPKPRGPDTDARQFSAARAMADVRQIAQRPHPVSSPDHARVQTYLIQRMQALGLQTSTQIGALSPEAVARLERSDLDPAAAGFAVTNLIGVLPGRNPALPAVALMAHYDSTPRSPGAADDGAGVAAILETVRALRARGPAERTLVVLLTDGEELNLDGARVFWGGHPLRDRIGMVINLEARGGGGRALMFETGPGNAETIALFDRATNGVDGGVSSNSLAVLVYELMPNDTDYTLPKARGVGGLNLAFGGRPDQYHTMRATPDRLDQGSVQHIGAQALAAADALLRAPVLPQATTNTVYADLFGHVVIRHPAHVGWIIGLAALGLLAFAAWRARRLAGLTFADIGRGAIDGLWFLSAALVVTQAVRLLGGGPTTGDSYYVLMARLPWMEIGVGLAVLSLVIALLAGRTRPDRRIVAGAIGALTLACLVGAGGVDWVILGAGVIAIGLSLTPHLSARTTWGGWTGVIALVLLLGLLAQTAAPQAAYLLLWPALLAAAVAAVVSLIDPGLTRPRGLVIAGLGAVLAVGWLLGLAHFVFLLIGMDLPGSVALLALLMLPALRAFNIERRWARPALMAALALLVLGGGISAYARIAEPPPAALR